MSVVIDNACLDDAESIAAVHIDSFQAAYRGLLPDDAAHLVLERPDLKIRARSWKRWLERSQVSTVVARVDGAVTGFCTLHPMPDEAASWITGEIAAFYILPSHWRRGLGRLLGEQMLAEARRRGFSEVVLWVLESNDRARHFYASLGYRPDGEKRVFLDRSDASLHELRYRRTT